MSCVPTLRYNYWALTVASWLDISNFCGHLQLAGWVNRFANAGDTAMVVAGNTAYRVGISSFFFVYCKISAAFAIYVFQQEPILFL